MIFFVRRLNDEEALAFETEQWPINYTQFVDEFGDALPDRGNGSQFIPEDAHGKFVAMSLVESTGLSYKELMGTRYSAFIEMAALARATQWRPATRDRSEKYL